MAEKIIRHSDLIEDNVFKPTIDEANTFLKVVKDLNEELVKTGAVLGKSLKVPTNANELDKFSKVTKDIDETNKALNETYRIQEKLSKDIANAQSRQAVETEKLKIQKSEQVKANKQLASEELRLTGEYSKQSKLLIELRKNYKDLAVSGRENGKVARGLLSDITALDEKLKKLDATVGQSQRNVGNYAGSFNGLNNAVNQITRELPAFTNSLQTGFLGISNNLPILADQIKALRLQNEALAASGQPTVSVFKTMLGAVFSFGTALSVGITLLTVYGAHIIKATASLFGYGEAAGLAAEQQKEFNDQIIAGTERSRDLDKRIADLKRENEVAKGLITKDASDRLKTEQELNSAILDVKRKFQDDVAKLDAAQKEAAGGATTGVLLSVFGIDIRDKEAIDQVKQFRRDLEQNANAEIERLRKIHQLELEKIAIGDKPKEIKDFRLQALQEENKAALLATEENTKFRTQVEKGAVITESDLRIQLIKERLKKEKNLGIQEKEFLENEIQVILLESKKKQEKIDEDYRKFLDAQDKKRLELLRKANAEESKSQILSTREGSKERLDAEIKAIESERDFILENTLLTETEKYNIIAESEEKIFKLQKDYDEKQAALKKKQVDRTITEAQNINRAVFQGLQQQSDAQQEQLKQQLNQREQLISEQQARAAAGLENTLAFEQQKRDEANLKLAESEEREARRREALQLAEVYFGFLKEYQKEGNTNASSKAFADTLIAKGISKTIASFYVGTEDTGKVSQPLDSNGGRLVIVHDNERILNKKQNELIGDISNDELAQLAYRANLEGAGKEIKVIQNDSAIVNLLANKLTNLENAIKNKKELIINWDSYGSRVEQVVENGMTKVIKHVKTGKPRI